MKKKQFEIRKEIKTERRKKQRKETKEENMKLCSNERRLKRNREK